MQKFNEYVVNDPRVDVTMLPVFDGVSMIKWKVDASNTGKSVDGLGEGSTNGNSSGVHADGATNGSGNAANGNMHAANSTADK